LRAGKDDRARDQPKYGKARSRQLRRRLLLRRRFCRIDAYDLPLAGVDLAPERIGDSTILRTACAED
jgi:hypothetical protein